MLKVQDLAGGYGGSQVLFGMSFEADQGEVIALIGRNRLGTTTTVKTTMGMSPPRGVQLSLPGT